MKNGKNPTLAQRKVMADKGLNSDNWLVIKDMPGELILISRENAIKGINKQKIISKG